MTLTKLATSMLIIFVRLVVSIAVGSILIGVAWSMNLFIVIAELASVVFVAVLKRRRVCV